MTPSRPLPWQGTALAVVLLAALPTTPLAHSDGDDADGLEARSEAARRVEWEAEGTSGTPRVAVKILGINDFHGQLSPKTVSGRPAGGAAVLAAYLKNAQLGIEDRSIIISDGDFVGASPANSALLQDEPSIQFFNTLANPFCTPDKLNSRCNLLATVGNHEFDEGTTELFRMMNGGNHANGPFIEHPYSGARFPYIAANIIDKDRKSTRLNSSH